MPPRAQITDKTALEGMKGEEIRFMSGTYGGKGKKKVLDMDGLTRVQQRISQ
jgi:hypothetical protein